jgi:hypothetical protein
MVTASAPCWVLVQSSTSAQTLWTGTLQAGQIQSIPATGTTTVELGSSAGTLKVNSLAVTLPSPMPTPFIATLQSTTPGQPTTSGSAAVGSTTTSSAVG